MERARAQAGLDDRITAYLLKLKQESGMGEVVAETSFDLIEVSDEREPPAMKG